MKTTAASFMLVCAVILTLGAQAPPSDIPKLDIEKYTLANGLEVILSEDRRLPIVGVDVWYHVGPAHEAPGRTGFAHLFEHMMFQGSKHVPGDAHFRMLEGAGGTGLNGTTNFDRTNYFETVPANQLDLALWLESDRMGYLLDTVDQAKLTNQQDVVRNERRQSTENTPYGIVQEALFKALYPAGHPYHGVVIGSHADIQAAKLEDVRDFFKQYYAPNNATLAIAGDIDKPADEEARREVFRNAQARTGGTAGEGRDAADYRRAASGRSGSSGAAARVHGVAHPRDLQRRGRRRRYRRRACSGRGARAACTRSSSTKSRSRRASTPISIP